MTAAVLQLNADFTPMKVISWERAVCLVLEEKVDLVESYEGRVVQGPSVRLGWPAVVALRRYIQVRPRVRLSRQNLLARDGYTCQYCGFRPVTARGRPRLEDLNIDHVVPRVQSVEGRVTLPWSGRAVGLTSWENLVCACLGCNHAKGGRTPAQAGMALRALPRAPSHWDAVLLPFTRQPIPAEWKEYVPRDWSDYWSADLD